MIDAIFEVPETWKDTTTITELQLDENGVEVEVSSEQLKDALKPCCWHSPPSIQMPSTRAVGGKKIVHALIESEAVIATVLGETGGVCLAAQGAIIPAVWDYSPLDGYEPVYDLTDPELPVLTNPAPEPILVSAATREIVVAMDVGALLEYMPDVVEYNADGEVVSTSRPTAISGLHQFSGRPWSI